MSRWSHHILQRTGNVPSTNSPIPMFVSLGQRLTPARFLAAVLHACAWRDGGEGAGIISPPRKGT